MRYQFLNCSVILFYGLNIALSVQVPPTLLTLYEEDKLTDFSVVEGRGVVLPCSVSGDPRPDILWFKDESPISETDYHYFIREDGSLEIFSADAEDTGTYRCTATNNAGEVDKLMDLFVQGDLSLSLYVTICMS